MAVVSSLGIGSGLDLSGLVTNLLAAERAPAENSLNRREAQLASDLSGVGLMKSALAGFQTSLAGLGNADSYNTRLASNSNTDALSVSSTNESDVGVYNIDINAVAKSHSLASPASTFSSITDTVGTGSIQIRFGTITGPGFTSFALNADKAVQTITVDSSNNSLVGLKDHINDGDFGVTAAIINDGNGYRLTLTSNDSGANNALEVSVTDTGDANNTDTNGLSVFAYNASAANLVESQAGIDASISINGLAITSSTNTLTEVIEGVTLTLNTTTTSAVSLNISESNAQLSTSIKDIVDSYNESIKTLEGLSSAGSETSQAGLLFGDAGLRNITNGLRRLITSPVDGLNGSVTALSNIGILTQADGTLSIDESKFSAAIKENPTGALALFTPVGQTEDSLISFKSSTSLSTPGNYPINITSLATQGVLNGSTINSFTVDADNDDLTITIDGISTGSISLSQGVYASADALASEIQSKINSASALISSSKSVAVNFDSSNNRFVLTSQIYGSDSKVEITAVDINSAANFGFSVATGITGVDVAGTIGGLSATGSGQSLSVNGLTVDVLGGNIGARGELNFSRGFVANINSLLNGYLNTTSGSIAAREDGLNGSLDEISNERIALEARMSGVESRLISQFTALDVLLSRFQSTSSFITDQLSNLPGSGQLLNSK
jgi:flagellar hook-associated protein 2